MVERGPSVSAHLSNILPHTISARHSCKSGLKVIYEDILSLAVLSTPVPTTMASLFTLGWPQTTSPALTTTSPHCSTTCGSTRRFQSPIISALFSSARKPFTQARMSHFLPRISTSLSLPESLSWTRALLQERSPLRCSFFFWCHSSSW